MGDAVDHSRVTRWFKKFYSGYKNIDHQTRSGRSKTKDSETMLQDREVNPGSSTWRISGELGISQSRVVCHLYNFGESIWS